MYKKQTNRQLTIYDFDQPLGLQVTPENRGDQNGDSTPGATIENSYDV